MGTVFLLPKKKKKKRSSCSTDKIPFIFIALEVEQISEEMEKRLQNKTKQKKAVWLHDKQERN